MRAFVTLLSLSGTRILWFYVGKSTISSAASLGNAQNFHWCMTAPQYPSYQIHNTLPVLFYLSTNCVSVGFALSLPLVVYTMNRRLVS